jgi:thioredoxin
MVEENCLVKFYADWCGPCKQFAPTVDRVASETGVKVVQVNVDVQPELAQQFGVRSIPALFAVKDGVPVGSVFGNKPEAEVRELAKKITEAAK